MSQLRFFASLGILHRSDFLAPVKHALWHVVGAHWMFGLNVFMQTVKTRFIDKCWGIYLDVLSEWLPFALQLC